MRKYYVLKGRGEHPYMFGSRAQAKGYAVAHGFHNYKITPGRALKRR